MAHPSIREPVGAGSYYPADPAELKKVVDAHLRAAKSVLEPDRHLKAVTCPHARLELSGGVAAEAFACMKNRKIKTVVLVGPDHYIGFEGVAVYPEGSFRTPLGDIPIDAELASLFIEGSKGVAAAPEAHSREHALEVQLPFLQRVAPTAEIVPVLMGFRSRANVELLATLLSRALDRDDVMLLATTDLSHYYPREKARELDRRLANRVRAFAPTALWQDLREGHTEACGGDPLVAVMLGAGIAGAEAARVLAYRDTGHVTGDARNVVGYLSAAFFRGGPPNEVVLEGHESAYMPIVEKAEVGR